MKSCPFIDKMIVKITTVNSYVNKMRSCEPEVLPGLIDVTKQECEKMLPIINHLHDINQDLINQLIYCKMMEEVIESIPEADELLKNKIQNHKRN